MSYGVYRNLFFQYLFQTSCGVYVYLNGQKIKKWMMFVSAAIGVTFIIWSSYFGNTTPLIPHRIGTAWPTAFWVMPFMKLFLVDFKEFRIPIKWLHKLVAYIGKASYHIFCIQLIWFVSGIEGKITSNIFMQAVVSIIVCVFVGCVYFAIEDFVRHKFTTVNKEGGENEKNRTQKA